MVAVGAIANSSQDYISTQSSTISRKKRLGLERSGRGQDKKEKGEMHPEYTSYSETAVQSPQAGRRGHKTASRAFPQRACEIQRCMKARMGNVDRGVHTRRTWVQGLSFPWLMTSVTESPGNASSIHLILSERCGRYTRQLASITKYAGLAPRGISLFSVSCLHMPEALSLVERITNGHRRGVVASIRFVDSH